jgi:hypothetical protein
MNVLDKYRNNKFFDIGNKHISFLSFDKNTESTVNFNNIHDTVLILQSHDYINIPPRERAHWEQYKIPVNIKSVE